jgi:hypothetical protein
VYKKKIKQKAQTNSGDVYQASDGGSININQEKNKNFLV